MGRPIDAEVLEREGWSLCRTFQKDKNTMVYEAKKPSDFPTIEERKNGKWIRHYSRPNVYADLCWHCSCCGYKTPDTWANKWNYCPNCGAFMRSTP